MRETKHTTRVIFPIPPADQTAKLEMDIYVRFIRYLRQVPTTRVEIKILSTIQFISDMTGHSDAQIARILVDLGLRAPRMAFPAEFLDFVDQALSREVIIGPIETLKSLQHYWQPSSGTVPSTLQALEPCEVTWH